MFGKKRSFEQERIDRERGEKFHALVAAKLALLGGDASIEGVTAAINKASAELEPNDGELTYEMDESL